MHILFSEFGKERVNNGTMEFSTYNRFDPAFTSICKYMPDAQFTIYSDTRLPIQYGHMKIVVPRLDQLHPRYGWRCHDYYLLKGLLDHQTGVICGFDTDMLVVSQDFVKIEKMAQKWGLCMPINPRYMARVDNQKGADGKIKLGCDVGIVYNCAPMAFNPENYEASCFLDACLFEFERNPCRLPVLLAKVAWQTGYHPYVLPPQWCVCKEHVGIGNEIIVHVGHKEVYNHYVKR